MRASIWRRPEQGSPRPCPLRSHAEPSTRDYLVLFVTPLIQRSIPRVDSAGYRDRFSAPAPQADVHDLVPGGSATKAMTAVLCLQLAEQGKLDLDAPFSRYVDAYFANSGRASFSFSYLWGSTAINDVTVRQLLSMRSGMHDYDDASLVHWTLMQPAGSAGRDFEPMDFVFFLTNKTAMWPPGQGGAYSGTGYVLLGLVLAGAMGLENWEQLDQASLRTPHASRPHTPCTLGPHPERRVTRPYPTMLHTTTPVQTITLADSPTHLLTYSPAHMLTRCSAAAFGLRPPSSTASPRPSGAGTPMRCASWDVGRALRTANASSRSTCVSSSTEESRRSQPTGSTS
jgi:CubicO group peptidase (beta-lactamase class C family)